MKLNLTNIRGLKVFVMIAAFCLAANSNAQILHFAHDTLNVGLTTWYQPIKAVYNFQNVSDHPVEVIDVDPGCGCLMPEWTKGEIRPGGKGKIVVTYNAEMLGRFDRPIVVIVKNEVPIFLRMQCKVVSEQVEQTPQQDDSDVLVEPETKPDTVQTVEPVVLPERRPVLAVANNNIVAGEYERSKKLKCELHIKNEGTEMLLINDIKPMSDAIIMKSVKAGLKPGQFMTVKFKLDTWKMASPSDVFEIVIESNDPEKPKFSVFVHCK